DAGVHRHVCAAATPLELETELRVGAVRTGMNLESVRLNVRLERVVLGRRVPYFRVERKLPLEQQQERGARQVEFGEPEARRGRKDEKMIRDDPGGPGVDEP